MSAGDDLKSSASAWGGEHDDVSIRTQRDNQRSDTITVDDLPPAYSGVNPLLIPMPMSPFSGPQSQPLDQQRSTDGTFSSRQDPRSRSRRTAATTTTTTVVPHNPLRSLKSWSSVPFQQYKIPEATLSADQTSVNTTSPLFLDPANPAALRNLLNQQARLPPQPSVRIRGTHMGNASAKTDFDLTISLNGLVNVEAGGRWRNTTGDERNVGIGGGNLSLTGNQASTSSTSTSNLPSKPKRLSLAYRLNHTTNNDNTTTSTQADAVSQAIHRFLQPHHHQQQQQQQRQIPKSLTLHRTLPTLPTTTLEGHIRTLLASLHYRGKLEITFPTLCSRVTVQRKPTGAKAVVSGWLMSVFNELAGTSSSSSSSSSEITIERMWDIIRGGGGGHHDHDHDHEDEDDDDDDDDETGTKDPSDGSRALESWWTSWSPAVRNAVVARRSGRVGLDDWVESQMGWRLKDPAVDWGMDYS